MNMTGIQNDNETEWHKSSETTHCLNKWTPLLINKLYNHLITIQINITFYFYSIPFSVSGCPRKDRASVAGKQLTIV